MAGIDPFRSQVDEARQLLKKLLPPEVRKFSTDLGRDASGEEALFIHLELAKNAGNRPGDIKKLYELTERIQIQLLGSGITLFPYVYLDEAA